MESKRQLYLMISKTDTSTGRIIRAVSHYRYNHVSLTLDPTLRTWVSFGRFYQDIPFYGGFIQESVERYLSKGYDVKVRIFRLDIPEEKYRQLQYLFSQTGQPECGLIYNFFDALASTFRHKVQIDGAYTCLSFACTVLGKRHFTIKSLNGDLKPYLIYDGPLSALTPDTGSREDTYFVRHSFLHGSWATTKQFADLSTRVFRHYHRDIVAQQLT